MSAENIGRDLLNVPMGDMIRDMAFAIAEAQVDLDQAGVKTAEYMSEARVDFGKNDDGDKNRLSMMELGFTPTFYQFVDTIIEVKIAIKITEEETEEETETTEEGSSSGFLRRVFGSNNTKSSTVDAEYSNKYSYSAEGSSLLRTKLQPKPPPAILEERIRIMLENQEGDDSE